MEIVKFIWWLEKLSVGQRIREVWELETSPKGTRPYWVNGFGDSH